MSSARSRSVSPTTKYRSYFSKKEQEILDLAIQNAFHLNKISVWDARGGRNFYLPGGAKFAVSYVEGHGSQIYPLDRESYRIIVDRVSRVMPSKPHYDTDLGTHWL